MALQALKARLAVVGNTNSPGLLEEVNVFHGLVEGDESSVSEEARGKVISNSWRIAGVGAVLTRH